MGKRFDRVEEIVHEYIRKFMEVPAITHRATFGRLRAIIDVTNQMVRALPNHGALVSNWDPIIVFIIISKLDDETRTDWKQQKRNKNQLTYLSELLEFLETRAIELQPQQGEKFGQMLRHNCPRPAKKVFQITGKKEEMTKSQLKCPVCKGPHRIKDCEKLKGECARVRTDIIRTLKMCFKCLLKHQFGMCDAEDCSYCGGPHNVLLCYKQENDLKNQGGKSGKILHLGRMIKPSTSNQQVGEVPRKRGRQLSPGISGEDWDTAPTTK